MAVNWEEITWVLLDMDGTLLDKHFDDYFWETLVPEEYARRQALDLALARHLVFARYQREEGTLNWTDIDFWSRELTGYPGPEGGYPPPHRSPPGHRGFS